jgi:hypothetical protein
MKWTKLKALCLLSLVFFSLSVPSWSLICYEDEEVEELKQIFNDLEKVNNEQKKDIRNLTTQLVIAEKASEDLKQEMKQQETLLEEVRNSYREERRWRVLELTIMGGIGTILGWLAHWFFAEVFLPLIRTGYQN